MANLTGLDRSRYVQVMFTRIAHRYDLMNRLMTAGQDVRWRQEVIQRSELPPNGYLLDLGAGTGDLAREALRQHPHSHAVAADFTLEMMRIGRIGQESAQMVWSAADALQLPFPQDTFDAVVSGFLLRNVIDLRQVLQEQHRLLKPGGRVVSLDTTRPPANFLSPAIKLYLHMVIPILGKFITGEGEAYKYLPDSTETFLGAEQLARRMIATDFQRVGFRRVMFGTVAIHWGVK